MPETLYGQIGFIVWMLVCAFAMIAGDWPERFGGLVSVVAGVATMAVQNETNRFAPEYAVMVVDIGVMACFVFLAWRSNRLWPIWASAMVAIILATHAAYALDVRIKPLAYVTARVISSYGGHAALAIGTWQAWRRREQLRRHH